MRNADGGVTVGDRIDENAKAIDIGQLLEGDRAALHLAPDRIGLLLATLHLDLDAPPGELVGELRRNARDDRAILDLHRLETRHDELVGVWHQAAEGEVFEFIAHALHAHTAGKRSVDVERVLGDAGALGVRHELEGAHVVQAVGELDQEHARVIGNGEQELAEILRLLGVLGDEVEPAELGQAVDQPPDLLAERLVDLFAGDRRVFDRVVQHRRRDGGVIDLELGQNGRHLERMGEIRIAGGALLAAVRLHREHIGAVQQILVGVRIVAANPLHQFVLPHHRRKPTRSAPRAADLSWRRRCGSTRTGRLE